MWFGALKQFNEEGIAMSHASASPSCECLIADLLRVRRSLTLEQVVTLLPELSWNQVFKTIDDLSRRGEIVLLRRGYDYEVEWMPARSRSFSYAG